MTQAVELNPQHVAFVPADFPATKLAQLKTDELSQDHWGIQPLGLAGRLRWGLPCQWAVILLPPQVDSILIVPKSAEIDSVREVWQELAQREAAEIQVWEAWEHLHPSLTDGPPLAPTAARDVPTAVRQNVQRVLSKLDCNELERLTLQAGIWQFWDELETSHEFAQRIEGRGEHRTGDYWHAIMHRREPDYGNAKYWCRRVGPHPIHWPLKEMASELLARPPFRDLGLPASRLGLRTWEATAFVDLCAEAAARPGSLLHQYAVQLQYCELLLLMKWSWDHATA
jgi:hypothetical protein